MPENNEIPRDQNFAPLELGSVEISYSGNKIELKQKANSIFDYIAQLPEDEDRKGRVAYFTTQRVESMLASNLPRELQDGLMQVAKERNIDLAIYQWQISNKDSDFAYRVKGYEKTAPIVKSERRSLMSRLNPFSKKEEPIPVNVEVSKPEVFLRIGSEHDEKSYGQDLRRSTYSYQRTRYYVEFFEPEPGKPIRYSNYG